jgi:hypothetical protein
MPPSAVSALIATDHAAVSGSIPRFPILAIGPGRPEIERHWDRAGIHPTVDRGPTERDQRDYVW